MTWTTIGFDAQKEYFERLLSKKQLIHAYLFSGPEMVGKKKLAYEVYQRANRDEAPQDILEKAPRVSEGESKIYIEDIREINLFLSRKPLIGPYKFVIIDDAHQLTGEASNALLKVLEEPSANTVIILISSQPRQILPTIISRCQPVTFLPHSRDIISKVLAVKRIDAETIKLVTETAGGRLGWALRMVESDSTPEIRAAVRDFQKLMQQEVADRMQYAKKLSEQGDYAKTVDYWLRWLHAHLQQQTKFPNVLRELMKLHYIISQPQYNHRLAIENFLLKL